MALSIYSILRFCQPCSPDSFKCIPGIDLGQVFNSLSGNIITADGQVDKVSLGMTAQDIKDKTGLEDINIGVGCIKHTA
jgi:hypothetical protein